MNEETGVQLCCSRLGPRSGNGSKPSRIRLPTLFLMTPPPKDDAPRLCNCLIGWDFRALNGVLCFHRCIKLREPKYHMFSNSFKHFFLLEFHRFSTNFLLGAILGVHYLPKAATLWCVFGYVPVQCRLWCRLSLPCWGGGVDRQVSGWFFFYMRRGRMSMFQNIF